MIKTEKVQTSDLAKARKAFLNLETEKASLVNKLAEIVFEVFKSASYNLKMNQFDVNCYIILFSELQRLFIN